MTEDDKFSLGEDSPTAASVYDSLSTGTRQAVIDLARIMSELTIPSVFPPDGYKPGDDIPGNNQSIGADCLNTLVSSLMFMAFPPNQPIMRFEPVEYRVQPEVDKDPDKWNLMVMAMARLELAHRKRFATTPLQMAYVEYLKVLVVAGNVLWRHIRLGEPTVHKPDCYVVKRNKSGKVLLIILKEEVSLASLDKDHVDFIKTEASADGGDPFEGKPTWEQVVDVYSVQKLVTDDKGEHTWVYWEEYEGKHLPDTEVEVDYETPPLHAGWLVPCYGEDWGRGYVEQYRGDLFTVEHHASSLNDGASLAALALIFNEPGSSTSTRQVRTARNLSFLTGRASDLSVFRSDKTGDLAFIANNMEAASRRLDRAFLKQVAVQRSGERVTAAEIERMGQEIDKALGGLYTQIAQGNQRAIIKRAVRLHEDEDKQLPSIPEGIIEVQVITGLEALGDGTEADALKEVVGTTAQLFPQAAQKELKAGGFFTRLAALRGVKTDGLVTTPEEQAAGDEQQQAMMMQQALIEKGTGPGIKAMADMAQGQMMEGPPAQ